MSEFAGGIRGSSLAPSHLTIHGLNRTCDNLLESIHEHVKVRKFWADKTVCEILPLALWSPSRCCGYTTRRREGATSQRVATHSKPEEIDLPPIRVAVVSSCLVAKLSGTVPDSARNYPSGTASADATPTTSPGIQRAHGYPDARGYAAARSVFRGGSRFLSDRSETSHRSGGQITKVL